MNDIPLALTFDDVLLVPTYSEVSSRNLVNLTTHITNKIKIDFPIISVNMETVTGIDLAVAMAEYGGISFYPRFKPPTQQANEVKEILSKGLRVIPAMGIKDEEDERVKALVDVGVDTVTIDVAHAHLSQCIKFLKHIKKEYSGVEVIVGVVGTYEGTRDLFEAGADSVRVGVGPGTICTTRKVTGSGVPRITAIMEAARAAKEFGKPIIADGGMKNSGDIVKALAAGANAAAVGSILAGSKKCPGEVIEKDGKFYKSYNGSTSKTEKVNQLTKYSKDKHEKYVEYVEGVESLVPYKGDVKDVLDMLDKGIRSGLSYGGSFTIEELHQKARFIRVTTASSNENGAHGVIEK